MHLLITQPYLPAYRVPLFERIGGILAASGDRMTVCVGQPSGEQGRRGDALSAPWSAEYKKHSITLHGRSVGFRTMPVPLSEVDVVVSELEGLNTFAWRTVLGKKPLVLWGHGKSYINDSSKTADRLKWALGRRSSHLMTYSPSGRDYLIAEGGFHPDQVTAIGNSTDTATLRSSTLRLLEAQPEHTPRAKRRHALYVGGLDPSKRIDFLLSAAKEAWSIDPTFKLHIVGRGALEGKVDLVAKTCDYIVRTPESRGDDLARLGWDSDVVWMPGRVGLVAVDALAMGLPVHTTAHDYHAPEIEFLHDGELEVLTNSPSEFAMESIQRMASNDGRAKALREDVPTIERVAQNFAQVVYRAHAAR